MTYGITPRGAKVFACAVASVAAAALFVALRFFTRAKLRRILGKDDWFIALALLFSIGNTIGMCIQADIALGKHLVTVPADQRTYFFKMAWFTIIPYNLGLFFTKISILLLYLRIFSTRNMEIACYVQIVLVTIYGLWSFFSSIFSCVPIALYWDKSLHGHCMPNKPLWFSNAAINIVTDFMIILLPMPSISSLNLERKPRIAIYIVFTLGFFVCIVSIVRLHSLYLAAKSTDPTWDNIGIAIWSSIELNTAIICACAMTLKPLVSRFLPRFLPSSPDDDAVRRRSADENDTPAEAERGGNKLKNWWPSLHTSASTAVADSSSAKEILASSENISLKVLSEDP